MSILTGIYRKMDEKKLQIKLADIYSAIFGINNWNSLKTILTSMLDRKNGNSLLVEGNRQLKDKYKGKRCFILGNGPSVKNMDLSGLEKEIVFTVNQFSKTDIYKKIKPDIHLWADERFFELDENDEGDFEIIKSMKMVQQKDINPLVFYKAKAKKFIDRYNLNDELNIFYYNDGLMFCKDYKGKFDLSKRIPWFPTVVQYGIALAIYMGFDEIYLLGCECTGIVNFVKAKDVSNISDTSYLYSYTMNEKEKEHFNKAMNRRNSAMEMKVNYLVLQYYDWLGEYCDKNKIALVNCTPGGILDSLPRCLLSKVLEENHE